MDVTWATQESEAVAEKVLRYRRDESGWKKCREGVSEGLSGKGDLETVPRSLSLPNSQASPLPEIFCTPAHGGGLRELFHGGWLLCSPGLPEIPAPFNKNTLKVT